MVSHKKQLWTAPFVYPIANPQTTDTYGYTRLSSGVEVLHKGTDFKADKGTEVHAMNRGVVRVAKSLPSYGKTIVIDHGKGIKTLYLHLSSFAVSPGELVERNQVIGKSGATGFVTGPHLHLSVHIGSVSIDPESFMNLLGEK